MAKKRRHEDHEEHVDESWLIPYADLLTLLLALFIVLFASGQTNQQKLEQISRSMQGAFSGGMGLMEFFGVTQPIRGEDELSRNTIYEDPSGDPEGSGQGAGEDSGDGESETERREHANLDALKGELDSYITDNSLATELETTLGGHYVMITIRDQALFASGSAQIKSEAAVLAAAIADILVSYPDYEVTVSGHTDDVPISTSLYASNWDLSTARSLNFMKELFRNPKINQKRFSSTGFGEFRPIASNDTAEGRAMNRRVEVSIISPALVPSQQIRAQ